MTIRILCLYPNEMNFYGDTGNVLALQRRLEWRGYKVELLYHHPGKPFDYRADIVVGGGGQDSGQLKIYKDLLRIGKHLRVLADQDVPMLAVCGTYQLFGQRFVTNEGKELQGIGIFDAETVGGRRRLVGNLWVRSPFGDLIGYENHSGQTRLQGNQQAFGSVVRGYGNGDKEQDGAVYRQVYGTYMHGSLLPRNPQFADVLVKAALQHAGFDGDLVPLDDTLANKAFAVNKKRLFK